MPPFLRRSRLSVVAITALLLGGFSGVSTTDAAFAGGSTGSLSGHIALGTAGVASGAGDVIVSLNEYVGSSKVAYPTTATTDAAGNYSFTGLPGSRFDVILTYTGTGDFVPSYDTLSGLFAGDTRFDAVVPVAYSISGHVDIDTAEVPATAGAVIVTARSSAGGNVYATTTTDAAGDFSFVGLLVRQYALQFDLAVPDGYPAWYYVSGSALGTPDYRLATEFTPTSDRSGLDVVVGHGPSISGVVRDSAGRPVANTMVAALEVKANTGYGEYPYGEWVYATTRADGSYVLRALKTSYRYRVSAGGSRTGYSSGSWLGNWLNPGPNVDVSDGQPHTGIDIDLDLTSVIGGQIDGPGISPVNENQQWQIFMWTQHPVSGAWKGPSVIDSRDEATGSWHFDGLPAGLPAGNYRFALSLFGSKAFTPIESDVITITEGTEVELDFWVDEWEPGPFDYSGDGVNDVLARDSSGALWMYQGDGNSGWDGASKIGSGWSGFNLVFDAGDFSGDGHPDVLARKPNGDLHLYRGNGRGGWLGASKIGSGWNGFNTVFGVGDFTGDGNPDVMARTPAGALHLYRGNGTGGWAGSSKVGSGWNGFNTILGVGDFSGDGNPDVMARTPAGTLHLYKGNGTGGWAGSAKVGTGWNNFNAVFGVGDFSGDGVPDVMARTPAGALYLYRGNGTGGWAGSRKIGSGWEPLTIVQ